MSRKKGNRRERQARGCYEDAGFAVERCQGMRYDRSDFYNHFDLLAVRRDCIRFVQVKSNRVSGIAEINQWAREHAPDEMKFDVACCHDNQGWRLLRLFPHEETYTCVVDERDEDCSMGSLLTDYLSV